jgi:hypothetical protein
MKLSLTLPLSLFLLLTGEVTEAATPWRGSVKSQSAALRAGVSATSQVVAVLSRGDAVTINMEITAEDGKWYSVALDGRPPGYISGNDLNVEELATLTEWEFQPPPEPASETESSASSAEKAIAGASKSAIVGDVKGFFISKFGRSLPVSAFGQTRLHSRLGFDHRNGVDVALNPDSFEGRAFIGKLRRLGIPFIAFRRAVPGVATGAHIHVGRPSPRK